jgi:hypothetical protein
VHSVRAQCEGRRARPHVLEGRVAARHVPVLGGVPGRVARVAKDLDRLLLCGRVSCVGGRCWALHSTPTGATPGRPALPTTAHQVHASKHPPSPTHTRTHARTHARTARTHSPHLQDVGQVEAQLGVPGEQVRRAQQARARRSVVGGVQVRARHVRQRLAASGGGVRCQARVFVWQAAGVRRWAPAPTRLPGTALSGASDQPMLSPP